MDAAAASALAQDERLVAELHRLGVRHLARLALQDEQPSVSPADLITALASHPEARFQSALILLFLRRPEYQRDLAQSVNQLDPVGILTLKLYYQAAVYLQRELATRLAVQPQCSQRLTDYFSTQLGLPLADTIAPGWLTAQSALVALGAQHELRSGWHFNWAGSYRQHIPLFLKHLGPHGA